MKRFTCFLSVMIFFIAACGPSLDSEKKSWERNLKKADKLKKEYPAYADLVSQKTKKAQEIYKQAEGITNEDEKVKKMVQANDLLEKGAIGALTGMRSKISSLKSLRDKVMGLTNLEATEESRVEAALKDAKKAIKKANKVLEEGLGSATKSATESERDIVNASNALEEAEDQLKSVQKMVSGRKDEIKKKEDQKKTDELKKEEEKKKAAQKIKCDYCGTMNEPGASKCKSCGAELPQKK